MSEFSSYFPSIWAIVGMCLIVFFASVVQASLGMGFGLTAAPLLAIVDPVFVPVATIIIGMISSTIGAVGEHSQILWADVFSAVTGRLSGTFVAAFLLLLTVDKNGFLVLFGCGVAVAVLLSTLGHSIRKTPFNLFVMGSVSGTMGTITGVGAPPLALVYQGSYAGQARPTLAAIFAFGCGISLLMLVSIGWVGSQEIIVAALMLPPMAAGTTAGRKMRLNFDQKYRFALLSLAAGAAVLLIIRGLVGLL